MTVRVFEIWGPAERSESPQQESITQ